MIIDHYSFKSSILTFFADLEIIMIRKCKYLITHTESHLRKIQSDFKIPTKNFTIIPHGIIEIPDLNNQYKKENQIVFLGRYESRKGIDILLNAIPLVCKKIPNVIFKLIGGDPNSNYELDFRNKFPQYVNTNVFFLGIKERDFINKTLAESSILVAPSRYESFGLIFVEAMQFGLPVIACNVGGATDIVSNGLDGFLIENFSYEELTDKIVLLLNDKDLMITMGGNAKNKFKDKFTSSVLCKKSLEYYNYISNQI